jgi:uncharacterized damage-inducible protein DinB
MSAETVFLNFSAAKLEQLAGRVAMCLGQLNDEQIWARGGDKSNAPGNLVLHLAGNVRQWIGTGVAGLPDIRQRDAEFAARGDITRDELTERLADTVRDAARVIRELPAEKLTATVTIQGYGVSVLEAIYHVVEHFSGHTGQIIFATKLLTGNDPAFYRHLQQKTHSETVP